jgi:hypothetical protein
MVSIPTEPPALLQSVKMQWHLLSIKQGCATHLALGSRSLDILKNILDNLQASMNFILVQ